MERKKYVAYEQRKQKKLSVIPLIVVLVGTGIFAGINTVYQQNRKPVSADKEIQAEVILEHQGKAFTEGLFFYNGRLYESSGLYGVSYVTYHGEDGTQKRQDINQELFAEGMVAFHDKLYLLTYREKKGLILNPETLAVEQELSYPREGWGLTTDGESLIASDGSDVIYYLDEQLGLKKVIYVKENGNRLFQLNELEYIDGLIYANIWKEDDIVVIHPETGNVLKRIDCSEFRRDMFKRTEKEYVNYDVLNGIAYDGEKIYLTGKLWDNIYECRFSKKFLKEMEQKKGAENDGRE